MGDEFNSTLGQWPVPGGGDGSLPPTPPNQPNGNGQGPAQSNYLLRALFVEGGYELAEKKGEVIVSLIRNPEQMERKGIIPGRYSHSLSKHSKGAPSAHHTRGIYSQFTSNYLMHAARNAFLEENKRAMLERQIAIQNGNTTEKRFKGNITVDFAVGWVNDRGNITTTKTAYFFFEYDNGTWRERTGHPEKPRNGG